MEELLKKETGITLIALIITIIVLLILAGITIGMLTANNGVLKQGQKAKNETEINSEAEKVQLAVHDAVINSSQTVEGLLTTETVTNGIKGEFGEDAVVEGDGPWVYTGKYKTYEITEKGEVSEYVKYTDTTPGVLAQNENGEFMIESIEDLVTFSAMVNGGYKNTSVGLNIASNDFYEKTVVLMRTLDFKSVFSYDDPTTTKYNGYLGVEDTTVTLKEALTSDEYKGFASIGNSKTNGKMFRGTFDGKGKSIKNINERGRGYSGLFGVLNISAEIKNLTVTGEIINSTASAGGIFSGTTASGKISVKNCVNYVNVTNGTYVGGICGSAEKSTIEDCTNYGTIQTENDSNTNCGAGGIVGYCPNNNSTSTQLIIKNCANNGKIIGKKQAGGIVGFMHYYQYVYNCYNSESAEIISDGHAGGIVGYNNAHTISKGFDNCYNLGTIRGNYAGGIMGFYSWLYGAKSINCYTSGNISGNTYVGGIAGSCSGKTMPVYNCYYLKSDTIQRSIQDGSLTGVTGLTIFDNTTIDALNGYIQSNPDGVDTNGWAKWKIVNGKPSLDFKTTWNSEQNNWATSD